MCVTVRELYKSRPSEFISSRRELQNLTFGLGRAAHPGDLGLVLSDLVSLRQGTARLSDVARKLGRFLSAISRLGEKYWCFERLRLAQARDGVVFGLEGLSPLGVWDVLGG